MVPPPNKWAPASRPGPRSSDAALGVTGGGRSRNPAALGLDDPGGAVHVLRELGAAVEHVALDLLHAEGVPKVLARELQVERLAGEDVDADEVLLRERVDADVALRDQHEAGEAPV